MDQVKASEFIIPAHPTPGQLEQMLAVCSNQIAMLAEKVAQYKSDVAIKTAAYKRAYAKALIVNNGLGNAQLVKALADSDSNVITAADALDVVVAKHELAKAEFDGWDAHFVALRKMSEIRKQEMSRLNG